MQELLGIYGRKVGKENLNIRYEMRWDKENVKVKEKYKIGIENRKKNKLLVWRYIITSNDIPSMSKRPNITVRKYK